MKRECVGNAVFPCQSRRIQCCIVHARCRLPLTIAVSLLLASPTRMEIRMHIASVGNAMQTASMIKVPEAAEGPGPDHDGDSDDGGSSVKSLTASGVGTQVDISA